MILSKKIADFLRAYSCIKRLDKPWFCMYNAQTLYTGLTDMNICGIQGFAIQRFGDIGFEGLGLRTPSLKERHTPLSSTSLHLYPI
jgi:hypothetical protein